MEIERVLNAKIKRSFKSYPILALLGPRQSGKTTLAKLLFPKASYWSLEDPDTREFAEKDPRGFLNQSRTMMIIDEAQRVPHLFSYLQTIVDERKKNQQFLITGSSNFLLQSSITQSLAGRVSIYWLLPLSITELVNSKKLPTQLNQLLIKGCYPKLYASKADSYEWYRNYVQTYLEKDVRLLQNIGNLSLFQNFLKLCATRSGQLLNLSSMGIELGVSHHTINSWLSVLEASFIIFRHTPFWENIGKRLVKSSKIYFYDTGLLCYLLGIQHADELSNHYYKGSIFENFVISEIIKSKYNEGKRPDIYFWRDKTGNEIDIYIPNLNKIFLIECKAGSTTTSDYFRGLLYYKELNPDKLLSLNVVYAGNRDYPGEKYYVYSWKSIPDLLEKLKR